MPAASVERGPIRNQARRKIELYSLGVPRATEYLCGLSRLCTALALILALFAPTALLASQVLQPPTMACCRKSAHACCKRKAAASRGPSFDAAPACKSECSYAPSTSSRLLIGASALTIVSENRISEIRCAAFTSLRSDVPEVVRERFQRPPPALPTL
jgi:hypothetical protein